MAKGFVLDSTSKSLQAFAATNSAQVDYVVKWADTTSTTFAEGSSDGQITSTTAADITPAPASNVKRVINGLTLYNRGSAAEAITLAYKNSSSSRYITRIVLTAGQAWSLDDMTTISATTTPVTLVSTYRNLLMNGGFNLAQRHNGSNISFTNTTTFQTSHAAYTFDRWFLLRQNASSVSSFLNIIQGLSSTTTASVQDVANGACIKLSPNGCGKFGIGQIIENRNCAHLAGQNVTLSFKAKSISTSSGVGNLSTINYAILSFAGTTADSVSRPFLINTASWGLTGINPGLNLTGIPAGSSYSYVQDGSASLTTSWQTISISTQLPSSYKNIAVIIWSNTTTTASTDNLFIADVQLEPGLSATSFEILPVSTIESLCQRYFYSKFASISGMTYATGTWGGTSLSPSASFRANFLFPVALRVPPTLLSSAAATFKTSNGSYTTASIGAENLNASQFNYATLLLTRGTLTASTSAPTGSANLIDNGGNSYLTFNAEL